MTILQQTPRTTAKRKSDRVDYDFDAICAVLDQSLVTHLGFVQDGAPFVLPTNAWRVGDGLYFHFATNGRFAQTLRGGAEICATVSLLDGLVLARSAMHHSVNYRSVMLFGVTVEVTEADEKNRVLMALVDKVWPGRAAIVRPPDAKELAVTAVFRLAISEGSIKARNGQPVERRDDLALPVWGGVVPLVTVLGQAQADEYVPSGLELIYPSA